MRCANCGSSKVFTDEKAEGYSIAKGIVGTALFGTGGAVMGVNGKSNIYYHCSECGQTLSYLMPTSVEQAINSAIKDPEIWTTYLKSQKKRYPNIEWNESIENDVKKELYEYSAEEQADLIWNYYLKNRIPYIEDSELIKALGFKENDFFSLEANEILKKKGLLKLEVKNNKLYYAFFDNAEDIKNNINELEKNEQIKQQFNEIWKENRERLINAIIELLKKESTNNEIETNKFYDKMEEVVKNEIKETDYSILCGYDELIKMIISKLKRLLIFGSKPYLIPSNTREEYFQVLLDDTERENYAKEKEKKRLEEQYGEIVNKIKKLLNENEKMTITEMQLKSEELCEYSQQRLSAIISRSNELEKIEDGKKVYYALYGTKEKLEEKKKKELQEEIERHNKEIEEIKKNNASINMQIEKINQEIKSNQIVVNENKYKLLGSGAKLKKDALNKISELEEQIKQLRMKLK